MAYDAQHALLLLALISTNVKDKKELKKRAIKIAQKCHHTVASGMMQQIINSPSITTAIYEHLAGRDALGLAIQQMIKDNFPCMVIHDGLAYGVQLETPGAEKRHEEDPSMTVADYKKEVATDRNWILANESEVCVAAAHAVMNHLNLQKLKCRVHMLRHFGFSGQFEDLEIERGVARKFDIQVGNSSNYFFPGKTLKVVTPTDLGTNVTQTFAVGV